MYNVIEGFLSYACFCEFHEDALLQKSYVELQLGSKVLGTNRRTWSWWLCGKLLTTIFKNLVQCFHGFYTAVMDCESCSLTLFNSTVYSVHVRNTDKIRTLEQRSQSIVWVYPTMLSKHWPNSAPLFWMASLFHTSNTVIEPVFVWSSMACIFQHDGSLV